MKDRVLVVGFGSIGKRHFRLAKELLPNSEVKIWRNSRSLNQLGDNQGIVYSIEEVEEFAPNFTIICNPAPFHIETAISLARMGSNILIEKPISNSSEGVLELIQLCEEEGLKLSVGYNLRFLKSLRQFRSLIREEVAGPILSIRCEVGQYLPDWRPESDYRLGVTANHDLGGGVLLELSHEIDYLMWIFGKPFWVNATLHKISNLEVNVEDTVHAVLGFSNPKNGKEITCTLSMDFIRHDTTRYCLAIGEKATIRWNGITGAVELFKNEDKCWYSLSEVNEDRDSSYKLELESFFGIQIQQNEEIASGSESLELLHVIEAIRESAAQERRIHLPVLRGAK